MINLAHPLHAINAKCLMMCLQLFEENGLISREDFATLPTMVEYSLTQKGEDFKEIIMLMYIWGKKWVQ